jgi:NitT/TauT family transport system permease protein
MGKINTRQILFIFFWIIVVLVWQLLGGLLNSSFFAKPDEILARYVNLDFWKLFLADFVNTLSRLLIGLTVGYLAALLMIFGSVFSSFLQDILLQLNKVIKYLPPPVIIPISILFFGINDLAKIFVVAFSVLVMYLSFLIEILQKDVLGYKELMLSWRVSPVEKFTKFIFPVSNFLNYRVIPSLIIWSLGILIITEIILGGQFGFGTRLLQSQQLYQTANLFAYIFLILGTAFLLERLLVSYFSRFRNDIQKKLSSAIILLAILGSIFFQFQSVASDLSSGRRKIVTYRGTLNLPLIVYKEKFNTLNLDLEYVSSGLQAMDSLQAGRAVISGYNDIPNVLAGINKNKDIKILSQTVEKKQHPLLFLITTLDARLGDFKNLKNSKIAYYPNNPVIQKGLDFVLLLGGLDTSTVEYVSSNDPTSLAQSLASGQVQTLLSLDPYIADSEDKLGIKRLNDKKTAIAGIDANILPLAGLAIDSAKLGDQDRQEFNTNLDKSIDFIRQNTDDNFKATGELREILKRNQLNENSSIPAFEKNSEIEPQNIQNLINLITTFGIDQLEGIAKDDLASLYVK